MMKNGSRGFWSKKRQLFFQVLLQWYSLICFTYNEHFKEEKNVSLQNRMGTCLLSCHGGRELYLTHLQHFSIKPFERVITKSWIYFHDICSSILSPVTGSWGGWCWVLEKFLSLMKKKFFQCLYLQLHNPLKYVKNCFFSYSTAHWPHKYT